MKRFDVTRILKLRDQLHSSYWFVPSVIVIVSILLALLLIHVDQRYQSGRTLAVSWLFLSKAESARVILSTIAASMITIVSLTFSMTIVVLTLASSQFGPRLLYNFMRDRANQVALGVFLACFAFCLIVLRTVQTGAAEDFVPHLGLTGALLFALFSIGMLIFYIHHVADSIQATTVIANVRKELELIVNRLMPEKGGVQQAEDSDWIRLMGLMDDASLYVKANSRGILQAIELEKLLQWAHENDLLLRLHRRPGQFTIQDALLFEVFPRERVPLDQLPALQASFRFGDQRTLVQDVEFAFQQLVEIALRALSPGINDPFTAMSCVEELGSALAMVAKRGAQSRVLRDSEDKPRLLIKAVDFEGLVELAFNQVRQASHRHPAVMMRMLETITAVAALTTEPEQRVVLRRHAVAIQSLAAESDLDRNDYRALCERFHHASEMLEGTNRETG